MRRPAERASAIVVAILAALSVAPPAPAAPAAPANGYLDRNGAPLDARISEQLDAIGIPQGSVTLDRAVQRFAEEALDQGIALARRRFDRRRGVGFRALGGAVVVLDLQSRAAIALASGPERDRSRAFQAVPPGSVAKPFVAAGALAAGAVHATDRIPCPARFPYAGRTLRNWVGKDRPDLTISQALAESCNTVFYALAADAWTRSGAAGHGTFVEHALRRFGFGAPTGLVPDEDIGRVPLPAPNGSDLLRVAIGQDGVRTTPAQVARAFATLALGAPASLRDVAGKKAVETAAGDDAAPALELHPENRGPVLAGLAEVPRSGTAAPAFAGFPFDRVAPAGKTGSAEIVEGQPYSWMGAYVPEAAPRYVVVSVVEQGGLGAQTSARIVRRVIEKLYGLDSTPVLPPDPLLPRPILLVFLAPAVLAGLILPGWGALAGAAIGGALDWWLGYGFGAGLVSAALAGHLAERLSVRLGAPLAVAVAAPAGLLVHAGLERVLGVGGPAWRIEVEGAAIVGLAAGAGMWLLRGLARRLVRRPPDPVRAAGPG